jgi:hypothetical protein
MRGEVRPRRSLTSLRFQLHLQRAQGKQQRGNLRNSMALCNR